MEKQNIDSKINSNASNEYLNEYTSCNDNPISQSFAFNYDVDEGKTQQTQNANRRPTDL